MCMWFQREDACDPCCCAKHDEKAYRLISQGREQEALVWVPTMATDLWEDMVQYTRDPHFAGGLSLQHVSP
jgi:hypothetical protein